MKKEINKRINEICHILQSQNILKSIGITLNNNGITSKRFYDSMKESGVGVDSIFGNNTLNHIQDKESGSKYGLPLEKILELVNELNGLIQGVNSIKLNLDRPLKKGDKLVAIDECAMDDDPNDKTLTIGKEYPILSIDLKRNRICVIDDSKHEHYFMFNEIHKFFEKNLVDKK